MSEMVPEGWSQNSIGECCEILDSQRIPLNSSERENRKGDYPYYGANGIQGYIDDFIFDGDAILVAEDGGNFNQYADRPIAQWVTGKYWVNNHAHILRARENDTDKWVYYSLVHKNILKFINGGTRAKLNQSDLREIEILSPPLSEQKKIASILTSVDEVIEKTQSQIDKLQDLKKGTMNELLTEGIGHTEFKDSELGRIPKSWEVVELKENLSFISYGFTNPMPESEIGNFMVTAKDVLDGRISYETARRTTNEAYKTLLTDKSRPKVGDILLTKDGTLGRVAIVDRDDICINQSVAVLRPNQKATSVFLFLLLSSPAYQKTMLENAGGSTIKHIYITVVDKMRVAIPKKEEQKEITSILLSLEKKIKVVEKKLHQTQSLKKSLMQDLLTGKVRVSVN